jgi:hypothetical protein
VSTHSQREVRPGSGATQSRPESARAAKGVASGPDALSKLDARIGTDRRAVRAPRVASFREFLEQHARVPTGRGEHGPYTFAGRECLIEIVDLVDRVIASAGGPPLTDATIALCGGAQFGKSILELNLGAYLTSCAWMNWGFYLPDKGLVDGMVQTKFRPDIVDQIDWFAAMTKIGKAVNKSGKSVNRIGAFSVTDGQRRAQGMILGLNKIPTSFTFDVTTLDEVDDIKPAREKFVRGRMTSSPVRLMFKIGTQRVAGRGQHKAWKDGSQGVMLHKCPSCAHEQNLEEAWPQCCRIKISTGLAGRLQTKANDGDPEQNQPTTGPALQRHAGGEFPQLQATGDFRHEPNGPVIATHDPSHHYYFACVKCGSELDRTRAGFRWFHRRPEQIELRNWSFRVSQFGVPAIDLSQIVAEWVRAVADPEAMTTFNCDRRAMPESTAQKITTDILDRARRIEVFDLQPRKREHATAFAGLDTGRRCWFFAREVERPDVKRLLHAEQIALGNVVERTFTLCQLLGISALFIDQAPATDEARTLALKLNGLENLGTWPRVPDNKDAWLSFPAPPGGHGGLTWDGRNQRWQGLRCAVVAFTKTRLGSGIEQGFDIFEKGGQTMFAPLIRCNRFETIDRVVREFLTPAENVSEVIFPGKGQPYIRTAPAMRLPRKGSGTAPILNLLDDHLLVGSEREEDNGQLGDYVDACENHLLLADGYSGLAELVVGIGGVKQKAALQSLAGRDRLAGQRLMKMGVPL